MPLREKTPQQIELHGYHVVKKYKYLGILMNSQGTLKDHINCLQIKINYLLN